ncbi:MAG: hypothetical protein A2076_03080 [Geobacteraceae bacterium GWC2_53_11]|nr:MAG: hypothetical protein A2076_03080 [Geobacteraceae bacterium GWC2_53_11]
MAVGLLLALIPTFIALRFVRLSKALKRTIIESKQANDALRESEALYRSILQSSPDGITVTDMEGRIRKMSTAVLTMFGYEREESALGRPLTDFIVPEDHERAIANIGLMFQGEYPGPGVYRAIRADGSEFDYEVNGEFIPGPNGQPSRMVFIGRDVTERTKAKKVLEESNRLLEALSGTDALTGLANRRRFDAILAQEHARHARSGAELSLILLDIDHFKAFNDTYGHVAGDDCLRKIAQAITGCAIRAADLPARYGGEEFACILPETDLSGAASIAEKIRLAIIALAIPHESSPTFDYVTASIGVVTISCAAAQSESDIIVLADTMLYKAKSNGRNRMEIDASFNDIKRLTSGEQNNPIQLAWKDTFCSGNLLIDSQHQTLFTTANELLDAILSDLPTSEISARVSLLLDDIALHFHDEEDILESLRFSALAQHKQEHERLLDEGRNLAQALNQGVSAIGNIFKFLVYEVVLQHMLSMDREFFPCINAAKAPRNCE